MTQKLKEKLPTSCALCGLDVSLRPIVDQELAFCCNGCHAVYRILASKNSLDGFAEHPVFQEAMRAGIISNPELIEKIKREQQIDEQAELVKLHLEVGEMWCPACSEIIRLLLLQKKGVKNCVVDYATDLASIEYAPIYISKDEIYQTIERLGYRPQKLDDPDRRSVSFSLYLRFGIAAFCALNIMMFSYPIYAAYWIQDHQSYAHIFSWLSAAAAIPVVTYCMWPIVKRFFLSLRTGLLGMETLVSVGVYAAFILSLIELAKGSTHVYFDSMSVIVALVLLGKIIENRAKFSMKETMLSLTRSTPKRGRKIDPDGSASFVPIKEVAVGDLLVAVAGERIILDGVVVEGCGACDESIMTGEALPVSKKTGDSVLSGSILQTGTLTYQTTATAAETTLSKIIDLVHQDLGHKSVYTRAVDPIVRWFVPAVLVIASCAALFAASERLVRFLSVVLISCPCAIGIAAPLVESRLMYAMAALGAIVRNRRALEYLGRETVVIFDKTGTVTEGRFRLVDGLQMLTEKEKQALKGLATQSTHPIAVAVASSIDGPEQKHGQVMEFPGLGMRDEEYLLGSRDFLQQQGVDATPEIAHGQATPVCFAGNSGQLTTLYLEDVLRHDIADVVASFTSATTWLLSGDAPSTVHAVASAAGFQASKARCSPLQKREEVDRLCSKGEIVAMVGDGINDAPALARAHVSISVVSATDISIQVSDILMTTDRMTILPKMFSLGRRAHRIIKQNLFWTFFYNIIGVVFAVTGYLIPLYAAGAMVTSSLIVILNTNRIEKKTRR